MRALRNVICGIVLLLELRVSKAVEDLASCSQEDLATCAQELRSCLVGSSNTTEGPECGSCMDGYVEWEKKDNSCVSINLVSLDEYLEDYQPVYKDESTNSSQRLALLQAAIAFIIDYRLSNINSSSYFELGLTPYSADSDDELTQRSGFLPNMDRASDEYASQLDDPTVTPLGISLPEKVDWVAEGAVTEVKNQGRCGCCWAIAMAGAIEGSASANPDSKGYLQNLSWQQLISCNKANLGCDGGSLVYALGYSWLNEFGGLTRNNEYPYSDFRGKTTEECAVDSKPLAVQISEPKIILDYGVPFKFATRVRLMKEALLVAPVAMAMKSQCRLFSNYKRGILTDDDGCACSSSTCMDHAILMVGYDDTTNPPCWILKNSWGTDWGEDGYFRISQEEKGSWGLFGVVAHGVQSQLSVNVTNQVLDDDLDEPFTLPSWVWVIIAIGAGCCCASLAKFLGHMLGDDEPK